MFAHRLAILSALMGAALVAQPVLAQTMQNSYIAGEGNESITSKHVLNAVLVGTNNTTQSDAELLSAFTVMGSNNSVGTAAVVFGNNNAQLSSTPGMASGSVQVGRGNAVDGDFSTQFGLNNTTTGSVNTTVGMGNDVQGNQNLVNGILVSAEGTGNAVMGWGGRVAGDNNARIGTGGSIQGDNNVTGGNSVEVTGNNQVALGTSARGFADGCVAIGSGSQCFESNEFSVGLMNNERRVTNVAPGIRYADAANVGQLRSVAQTLGAGADVVNGVLVEPIFQFRSGAEFTNVADAMYYLDGRIANAEEGPNTGPGIPGPSGPEGPQGPAGQDGKDGTGGGAKVSAGQNIQVADNDDGTQTVSVSDKVLLSDQGSLRVGATTVNGQGVSVQGGPSLTASGVNAGNRKVTGVAAGAIAPGSTDAINGGQLWDYQRQQDDRWDLTDRRFRQLDKRLSGVCAMAQANAQMATSTSAIHGENRNRFALGVGGCGGQGAVSIGYTRDVTTPRGSPSAFSIGISRSGQDTAGGAAWAIGW